MDPRAFTGFEGIGLETITVYADDFDTGTATIEWSATESGGSAQVGLAVTIVAVTSNKVEVDLVGDGQAVLGKLLKVEPDGACTVQVAGGCTLPGGDGATLTLGAKIVGDLGADSAPGYIRAVAATTGSYVQGTVDDAIRGRGLILDNATTTAVEVWLG